MLNTFTLYFLSVAGVAPEAVLDRRLDVGLVQIPDRRLASLDLGNYFKAETDVHHLSAFTSAKFFQSAEP